MSALKSPPTESRNQITERRKLQNREAQRKYRQRAKARLEQLEREVAQKQNDGRPPPPHHFDGEQLILAQPEAPSAGPLASGIIEQPDQIDKLPLQSNYIGSEHTHEPALLDSVFSETEFWEMMNEPWTLDHSNLLSQNIPDSSIKFPDPTPKELSDVEFVNFTSENSGTLDWDSSRSTKSSMTAQGKGPSSEVGLDSQVASFRRQDRSRPRKAIYLKNSSRSTMRPFSPKPMGGRQLVESPQITSAIIEQLRLDNNPENQSLIKTTLARGHDIRDVILAGLGALGNPSVSNPKPPNPLGRTLTLQKTSTMEAYLIVASSLKMHIPDLFFETCQSPFYSPNNATMENTDSLIMSYVGKVAPDLQPTPAQLIYPHHPWLDLVPFPMLRERALVFSAMDPPAFDLYDLKMDICMNNGMFCWRNAGKIGDGHAWDKRSWEAEPWFLKKWWILLGGEESDVWKQTRWWRGMKGDERIVMP
ncbi:hypothetical protein B0J14DRAFT_559100 [Halenospora varia]|nr:hypothetical protein B0J14DRAFT_559100 [Halenospora varia]